MKSATVRAACKCLQPKGKKILAFYFTFSLSHAVRNGAIELFLKYFSVCGLPPGSRRP